MWIQQAFDAADASGLEGCSVHDERVQLHTAIAIEESSASGVEGFVVLQRGDRLFHRIQRGCAAFERLPTGGGSSLNACPMGWACFVGNGPCATVHNNDGRRQKSPQAGVGGTLQDNTGWASPEDERRWRLSLRLLIL